MEAETPNASGERGRRRVPRTAGMMGQLPLKQCPAGEQSGFHRRNFQAQCPRSVAIGLLVQIAQFDHRPVTGRKAADFIEQKLA